MARAVRTAERCMSDGSLSELGKTGQRQEELLSCFVATTIVRLRTSHFAEREHSSSASPSRVRRDVAAAVCGTRAEFVCLCATPALFSPQFQCITFGPSTASYSDQSADLAQRRRTKAHTPHSDVGCGMCTMLFVLRNTKTVDAPQRACVGASPTLHIRHPSQTPN